MKWFIGVYSLTIVIGIILVADALATGRTRSLRVALFYLTGQCFCALMMWIAYRRRNQN